MEQNTVRLALWRNFLVVPHRDLTQPVTDFSAALPLDPDFVGKAMFAMQMPRFNAIRDLADAGTIVLLTAPPEFQILRRVGRYSYRNLPPYRAIRVDDFIDQNLFANGHVRKAAYDYLGSFADNPARLAGALMRPGVRAGFDRMLHRYHLCGKYKVVKDAVDGKTRIGKLDLVGQLAKLDDPIEQAKLAAGKKLTDTVLASVLIPHPATIAVRLEAMTPAEALNARGWLEAGLYLDEPELFKLWSEKVGQGTDLSAATLQHRKSVGRGQSDKVGAVVAQDAEKALSQDKSITRDILLVIDISGSMARAIEFAKLLAERVLSKTNGKIMMVACNDSARVVDGIEGLKLLRANGGTCLGGGLVLSAGKKFVPSTVVVVTDDAENRSPLYADVAEFAGAEHFFMLLPGDTSSQGASGLATRRNWRVSTIRVKDDWQALDQVARLLQSAPGRTIVDDILELRFPLSI